MPWCQRDRNEAMIFAFAGRRIDAVNAEQPRFPLSKVSLVRSRVRTLLRTHATAAVVSSAACGADLIALTEARALRLRCKIVLPFSRDRFRTSSVTDRPGNWGAAYDQTMDDAEASGDVIVLDETPGEDAYLVVNRAIIDATAALMNECRQPGSAVLVWEGASKGDHDVTEEFGIEARKRGLSVIEVLTL